MLIKNLVETCSGCPSQWEAETENGEYVYIRYRHGWFSMSINDKVVFSTDYGEPWCGVMSGDDMIKLVESETELRFER